MNECQESGQQDLVRMWGLW